jgi:hypothetical protein
VEKRKRKVQTLHQILSKYRSMLPHFFSIDVEGEEEKVGIDPQTFGHRGIVELTQIEVEVRYSQGWAKRRQQSWL